MAGFAGRMNEIREKHSDLVIIVKHKIGDKKKETSVKCNKIFLRIASPFFEELLKTGDDTIVIEESNVDLFNIIIDYVYTHKVDLSHMDPEDIRSLIMMSSKYKLPELMELCGDSVSNDIESVSDLTIYFNLAIELNIKTMKESCLKIIRTHAGSLFCHESFMTLHPESVKAIIEEDDLNISEMELFLTVLKWAENKYPDFYEDAPRRRFVHIAPANSTENYPFYLRSIENKLLSIIKVEPVDFNLSGMYQTGALINNACNNEGIKTIPTIEVRPDDYWIKIRQMLDKYNITKSIRFMALDPLEFSHIISSRNILTNDELAGVLKILNSSDDSLKVPPTLSHNRKPRKTYSTAIHAKSKLRIHIRLFFEFLQPLVFDIEGEKFSEEYRCVSTKPLMLTSIILPPKQRTGNSGGYVEDILIEVFKKTSNGKRAIRFASATFISRRRFRENISVILSYNIKDHEDAVLHEGSEFIVEISNLSKGTYDGGLTRTSLNDQSQFIVANSKIQKGIIAGFCCSFDVGM